MKLFANTAIFTLAGVLALGAGSAVAGPCTDRLSQLEKKVSASDAGSGPTNLPAAGTTAPNADTPRAGCRYFVS